MDKRLEILQLTVAEAAVLTKTLPVEISTMWWGSPGIGKTLTILDTFKDQEVIPVLAGCSEPTDFTGIPFDYKGLASKYLGPMWALRCSEQAEGIPELENDVGPKVLFFDDVVTAHEQTQAALYKVFHERRVGELIMRDNVRMIAAGNRIDDKSAVVEMPMALGNRMAHFYIKVDTDTWLEWARRSSVHPMVVAYIRTQPQRITNFDQAVEGSEKAFASPRTWDLLSRTMFNLDDADLLEKYIFKMAAGIVGAGIASEFTAFVKTATKLVPPDEIVKNPKKARVPTQREIDILHATVSSLEHYITKKENNKYWREAMQYALRIMPELGLILAKQVVDVIMKNLPNSERLKAAQSTEFQEMFNKWGDHLTPV